MVIYISQYSDFTLYLDNYLLEKCHTLGPASVAQVDAHPTGDQEVVGSAPTRSATFFVEIDHEIFSTVIFSFLHRYRHKTGLSQ